MYMYPIVIDYNVQIVRKTKDIKLNDNIQSINAFKNIVKDNQFYFWADSDNSYITIIEAKKETKKEYNARIKKQETYNEKYNEFHKSKKL